MGGWTLDDIPWDRFARDRLDPELVRIVKAASLVEHNGGAYAHHLCRIFADDPGFQETARRWGEEEMQHGRALARWASLADPEFDFDRAFARFQAGFQVDFDSARSRRGSRSGEMVARCVVEIGTSAYYTALREAAAEPVLREICHRIAADELRHYRLFYKNLDRCLAKGPFDEFAIATAVLTRLPVGVMPPADGAVAASGWAFPLVGAGIGAIAALTFLIAELLGCGSAPAALLAVAVGLAVTGAFHEDGL